MKNDLARILVASNDATEAQSVADRLGQDFGSVRASVAAEPDAKAFAEFAPQVLVLAIKGVSQAEHYFLGLLRSGVTASASACRTILLCSKEEVAVAFDLCKKSYFDDYVLHWPIPYDGMRLTMCVWAACRDSAAPAGRGGPPTHALIAHARSLDAVDTAIAQNFSARDRSLLEPHLSATRAFADQVRQMRLAVLIVEDDPLACSLIAHILADQPVDLAFAADAPTALSAMRRHRPDLVFMDVRLPGIDGVTLTRTIKAMPGFADVPILMLTGSAKRETVAASMAAGAEGFLVKPVTREALLARIGAYLPHPGDG